MAHSRTAYVGAKQSTNYMPANLACLALLRGLSESQPLDEIRHGAYLGV
jgi:hypothetical protein